MPDPRTFEVLATHPHPAAIATLRRGGTSVDPEIRSACIAALARRVEPEAHQAFLDEWIADRDGVASAMRSHVGIDTGPLQASLGKRLTQPTADMDERREIIALAVSLNWFAMVRPIFQLCCTDASASTDPVIGPSFVTLASEMGGASDDALHGGADVRRRATERAAVATMMLKTLRSKFQNGSHPAVSSDLLDAFLAISSWNDASLRDALDESGPLHRPLIRRLRDSSAVAVMTLLADAIQRRDLVSAVLSTLLQRRDEPYRRVLLASITASPRPATLINLREYGLPECLRGGRRLLLDEPASTDAAIAQAYAAAMPRDAETLALVLAARLRCGPAADEVAALCLSRVQVPPLDFWVGAATAVDDLPTPETLLDANKLEPSHATVRDSAILSATFEILNSDHAALCQAAKRLLASLNVNDVLPGFNQLPLVQQRRLGRVLMNMDASSLLLVADGLRHPVLDRRLEAIEFAESLCLIDAVIEPLRHIAKTDHQTARIRVAEALVNGRSMESEWVLLELSESLQTSIAETAKRSLERRRRPGGPAAQA